MENKLENLQNKQNSDFKKLEKESTAAIKKIDLQKVNWASAKDSPLKGKTFAIKDNFAIKGETTTSGTILLKSFLPNYSSTVYDKLLQAGAVPLYKANLDEIAMGGTGLTSSYGVVLNPYDQDYIIGGSSSGSAYLVARDYVDFSLGSDTGDSIRKPASYAYIVGFKPSWGLVSRYGLFDFSPSWDTVGWFTKSVDLSAQIFDILCARDPKDGSSIETPEKDFFKDLNNIDQNSIKLGIPHPSFLKEISEPKIREEFQEFIDRIKKDGFNIQVVELNKKIFRTILLVYRIITSIDAFSSNANLTGFLFGDGFQSTGNFNEDITKARSNFNYEVKRRFLFANEAFLNNGELYIKAKKIRNLIIQDLANVFSLVDALIMPANSTFAHHKDKILKENFYSHLLDDYLSAYNANGSPSITIPIFKDGYKTFGINIATKPLNDKKCLQIAKLLEGYKKDEKK